MEIRHFKAYDTVFRSLDLETLADRDGEGREGRSGRGGGKGAGGRRHSRGRGRASLSAQNTWRVAPYMGELLLDIKVSCVFDAVGRRMILVVVFDVKERLCSVLFGYVDSLSFHV